MKAKQIFYKEYMTKKKPKLPRFLCTGFKNYILGIVSPSLYFMAQSSSPEKVQKVKEFELNTAKYMCYKRKLNKNGWKALHREKREEKRERECTKI